MSPEQFTFWLQGFFELTDSKNLSANQVKMIKEHLGLVFIKVTAPLDQKPKGFNDDSIAAEDLFPLPLSKEDSKKIQDLLGQSKESVAKRVPMRPQGNHRCWAHEKIC